MDKRKLSKIPREQATPEMMKVAERLGGRSHIATASLIEDKKILQLTFYRTDQLREGKPEADFRTFLSDSDYITQDLKVSKVKWLTASFSGMWNFSLLDYVWDSKKHESSYKENVFIWSDEELKIMEDFFGKYMNPEDKYKPWSAIHRFQCEVKEKRLAAKHKKETDKIDAVMNPIKDAPEEFFDWVWEKGMSFSRYLIYKEEKRGKAVCECTHCKKVGVVDRKDIRLRNNEKGICPFCGSRVTIKARGRMPAQILDERWFLYVDPTETGFVLRYFKATRHIRSDSYIDITSNRERVEQNAYEYSRAIYTFPNGKPKYVSYEWGVYKQRGLPRWCPDAGNINCMECILYPDNLPQAWEHTPMKYSALEVLSANIPTVSLRYEDAIEKYLQFPKLEWLCKMGLNNLARNVINNRYSGGMVGKVNYKGGCWQCSYMRYKEREDPRIERKRNMAKDWLEYLGWCKKLNYDLDNMFIYMPTNFKKVHDRTYKEYQEQQDRIAAEERKRREREAAKRMKRIKQAMEDIFNKNAGVDAFAITGKGLMLMVPKSADEIKAEGTALHHCVGTYVERVAKGETMILFIRKIDAPDEPYYTMEWNGSKVVQCRGFKNCDMTPEVKAFTQVFEKKIVAAMAKKKEGACA